MNSNVHMKKHEIITLLYTKHTQKNSCKMDKYKIRNYETNAHEKP